MVITKQTRQPTVFDIRELVRHGAPLVALHRGCGQHESFDTNVPDEECWCVPAVLDANEVRRLPIRTLALIVAEHYAVQ